MPHLGQGSRRRGTRPEAVYGRRRPLLPRSLGAGSCPRQPGTGRDDRRRTGEGRWRWLKGFPSIALARSSRLWDGRRARCAGRHGSAPFGDGSDPACPGARAELDLQDLVRRVEALERRLTQGAGSLDSRPSTAVARETPPPSQPSSVRPPWDWSTDTRSGSLSPGSSTARATPPASKRPALVDRQPREGRVGEPGPDARGMDAGSRPAQETTPSASSWETQRAGATPSVPRESAPSQASQVPGGDATPDEQSLLQAVQSGLAYDPGNAADEQKRATGGVFA